MNIGTVLLFAVLAGRYDHTGAREQAVLDLALAVAVAVAADRYRLSEMGTGNARLIADAITAVVTATLGLPRRRGADRPDTDRHDTTASLTGALTSGVTP